MDESIPLSLSLSSLSRSFRGSNDNESRECCFSGLSPPATPVSQLAGRAATIIASFLTLTTHQLTFLPFCFNSERSPHKLLHPVSLCHIRCLLYMMFKQSPSRSLRAPGRGYKVKHVSQICITLAVSLWMMYQLRHCYFNKASVNERTGLVRIGRREDKAGSRKVAATLGRKGLLPGLVEDDDEDAKITDEAGRWDEFEQVDDLMEETDEQEADTDDTEQENQSDDDLVENLTKRNRTDIGRD